MRTKVSSLVNHAKLQLTVDARADLESGLVDERLVHILRSLLDRHRLSVRLIKTGHPMGPTSPAGVPNAHYDFRAMDIDAVDGLRVADNPTAPALISVGRILMRLRGAARPTSVMGPAPWHEALGPGDRVGFRRDDYATGVHHDHLHIAVG